MKASQRRPFILMCLAIPPIMIAACTTGEQGGTTQPENSQSEVTEAEFAVRQARQTYNRLIAVEASSDPVAKAAYALALASENIQDYATARSKYKESADLFEATHGRVAPELIDPLRKLGLLPFKPFRIVARRFVRGRSASDEIVSESLRALVRAFQIASETGAVAPDSHATLVADMMEAAFFAGEYELLEALGAVASNDLVDPEGSKVLAARAGMLLAMTEDDQAEPYLQRAQRGNVITEPVTADFGLRALQYALHGYDFLGHKAAFDDLCQRLAGARVSMKQETGDVMYWSRPRFPVEAAERALEGAVRLGFVLSSKGLATDVEALRFEPQRARIFWNSLRDSTKYWCFSPASPQRPKGQEAARVVDVIFELSN